MGRTAPAACAVEVRETAWHWRRAVGSMMEYQRSDRVGDLLLELIAELLSKEIRDPRVHSVTLTTARVSKDLRHARVYFSLLGGQEDRREALAGLRSATGFIRAKVGKQLNLRFVPSIEFNYDDTEDEARRIDALLNSVKE
ncbi:MAG: 30S ribosome-binding factor RbfA [Deltaproteobacteria bacterium]|nr:MAG: 30S ribosome-binding factor RbfA [Deltaproteobacteria bacterium]